MKVRARGYTVGSVLVYELQVPSAVSNCIVRGGSEFAAVMATSLRSIAETRTKGRVLNQFG
jgi:hypothetical protein